MTVEHFLMLLAAFSIVTSLFTEAVKKFTSEKTNLASNVIVLFVSLFVGGFGMSFYYVLSDISITPKNVICIILMICANWLCSMLGYDKVLQSIKQIGLK